jgi:hypothetical protein
VFNKIVIGLFVGSLAALAAGMSASATNFNDPTATPTSGGATAEWCAHDSNGDDSNGDDSAGDDSADLMQHVQRFDQPDGSSQLRIFIEGPIDPEITRADGHVCLWIDSTPNGIHDPVELLLSYVARDLEVTGSFPDRKIVFQLNVPGAAGRTICSQASGTDASEVRSTSRDEVGRDDSGRDDSGTDDLGTDDSGTDDSGTDLLTKLVCSAGAPIPQIPEVPVTILLTLTGALTASAAIAVPLRRR